MNAALRALNSQSEMKTIEMALGARDMTSYAMRRAIDEWFGAWFRREPTGEEDPCQRLPYAIVNKLVKATFAEYDSSITDAEASPKGQYLNAARQGFDAKRRELLQWVMVGGECLAKPLPEAGRVRWQLIRRDSYIVLGRDADGRLTDIATAERTIAHDRYYTLIERRTVGADGLLTLQNRLYEATDRHMVGNRVPLATLPRYAALAERYTYPTPLGGLGLVQVRLPMANCVDGSGDGVAVYEPALGLIHNINRNEWQLGREFELGRARIVASADVLATQDGRRQLKDDVFVGLEDNPANAGITTFSPSLRNANYEQRRQAYLKAVENLLGIKRGMLSDAEAVSKTATEINSSAGDYSLSIIDYQNLYYDALQEALRLADQLGQVYRLCDGSTWDKNRLTVTWGNGVLYDADAEWQTRLELVQSGLLKPELALAWKFDLPCETDADLAFIRQKYMPELTEMEG